jgi:beta-glucosidase
MKKNLIFTILFFTFLVLAANSPVNPRLSKNNIDEVIAAMTLKEKAALVVGSGMRSMMGWSRPVAGTTQKGVNGAAGTTIAIPRLGIPFIVLSDGPAGLRINPTRKHDPNTYYATAFPIGTLLASTWDTALVGNVGKAMGNEELEYGVDVILGPGVNIIRNPLCGRNFEYYSEDPVLAGKIAAAMINGIQSNGVGTSVKHYAVNSQETNRNLNDARVSQRALREIYLRGWEILVNDAQPWTIMSSYNKINGTYSSHNRGLLTDVLRNDFGFKGIVMTDWYGGRDAAKQIAAGNDLQEPGRKKQKRAIIKAIKKGILSEEDLNTSVKRILQLVQKSPTFPGYKHSDKPDLKAHAAVTRQSAAEGMVLLENNGALPLNDKIKNVALFGTTSYDFIAGGFGSGDVNEAYTVSLEEGLANMGLQVNQAVKQVYDKYFKDNSKKHKKPRNTLMAMMKTERLPEFVPDDQMISAAVSASDVAIITIGRNQGEGKDRVEKDDFLLTEAEQDMINKVCEAYHSAGKKVLVVINAGGVIETAGWKKVPDAVLMAWQAGQEGGNSVADILRGNIDPNGKLPMTFPVTLADDASTKNFPAKGTKVSMLRALIGGSKEKKPEKQVRNIDYTYYEEDIYVGYRYFNTFGVDVSYPFGYGMSYTTFEYSEPVVYPVEGGYIATIKVTNTGRVAGKEVVELYASAPQNEAGEPARELIAFAKTKNLSPGESQVLTMTFTDKDLAWFDSVHSSWILDPGEYTIAFSASSRDVKEKVNLKVDNEKIVEKVNDVLKPEYTINALTQK